jgi:hypothetical protein
MHNRTEVVVVKTFQAPLNPFSLKVNKTNRRAQASTRDSLRRFISDIKEVLRYLILDGSVEVEWQRDGVVISRKLNSSVLFNSR